MIDFRILGAIELRNDDGVAVRSVLSQPRRVALLAHLALSGARGVERRDTLLGVFWPESDHRRARGALRNAIHFLRRSLGADAIEARTEEELRVDPGRVRCDAVEFLRLLEEGRPAEALELYRGDLLEGFFISGAPAFDRWVEEERRGLRELAVRAAEALAEEAEAEGRLHLAVQHARRALTLSRDDDRLARRLVALLVRAGDGAGALRAFEEFEARLAASELEPSREARALVAALREGAIGVAPGAAVAAVSRSEARGARAAAGDSGAGRAASPAPSGADRRAGTGDRPIPGKLVRRPRALAAVAVALVLLLAGIFRGARAPTDDPSPDVVAVLPFSFQGDAELRFLGEGMVHILSADLDGAAALRAVDPGAVLSAVAGRDAGALDPAAAAELARDLGAARFVVGDVLGTEGRLRIRAAMYEAGRRPPRREREVRVEGTGEGLFEAVDELAARLVEGRARRPFSNRADRGTRSIAAWKAYLRGEADYRAGRYGRALAALQEAVNEDSAFAMAHYRLSNAAIWAGRDVEANRAARRALALAGGLSREDSLLVAAWSDLRGGSVERARALYGRLVELRPDHVEAWLQLGEVRFHWGPTFGAPSAEATAAFEKVLEYDPEHVAALLHLARLAAQAGEVARLDSLVERALAREPEGPWILEMESLRAVLSGDPVRRERALGAVAVSPEPIARSTLRSVAAFTLRLGAAADLARRLRYPGRSEGGRSEAALIAIELELARGRWRAAREALSEADELRAARALEFRAMIATLPFLPVTDAEAVDLLGRVKAAHPAPPPGPERTPRRGRATYPDLDWEGIFEPRRLYLAGSLAARLGRAEEALEAARRLERSGGADAASGRFLARLVRARVALLWGDPAAAEAHLGEPRAPPLGTYETVLDYASGYERYLRGQLAEALGRPREGIRWYATFPTPTAADLPYLAPATLARARLHESLGEGREAAALYARFLELWADADAELRPAVEEARERLDRL